MFATMCVWFLVSTLPIAGSVAVQDPQPAAAEQQSSFPPAAPREFGLPIANFPNPPAANPSQPASQPAEHSVVSGLQTPIGFAPASASGQDWSTATPATAGEPAPPASAQQDGQVWAWPAPPVQSTSPAVPYQPNAPQWNQQPDAVPRGVDVPQVLRDPAVAGAMFQDPQPSGARPEFSGSSPAASSLEAFGTPAYGTARQEMAASQLTSIPVRSDQGAAGNFNHARQLVGELERRSAALPMPGFPLTLEEALHQTPPALRREMVAAYWQTWRDVQLWSRSQSAGGPAGDNTGTGNTRAETTVRELALRNSQAALRRFFPGLADGDYRPVPVDQPLVASYTTHYAWYAERGRGSEELDRLDAALPVLLQELERLASPALAELGAGDRGPANAASAMAMRESALGGEAAITAFLETVCQYNSAVSHYTLTLIPNQPAPVELVRMLVPARSATTVLVDTEPSRVARMTEQVRPDAGNFGQQQPGQFGGSTSFAPQQNPALSAVGNPATTTPAQPAFNPPPVQDQGTRPFQPMQLPGFQSPAGGQSGAGQPAGGQPGANPAQPAFQPPQTNSRQPSEDVGQMPNG